MKRQMKTLSITLFSVLLAVTTHVSIAEEATIEKHSSTAVQEVKHETLHTETISLNKSSLEQLITLKGVGKKKAHAIISYRQQSGEFKEVNDLLNVKGIGIKVIEENQTRLKI